MSKKIALMIVTLMVAVCNASGYKKVPVPYENPDRCKYGLLTYPRSGTVWFMYTVIHGANRFWKKGSVLWHILGWR